MDSVALGRTARRRRRRVKSRTPGELDTPGKGQAPFACVQAPADLDDHVPTTAPAAGPLTKSKTTVVVPLFFLWFGLHVGYLAANGGAVGETRLPWSISAVQQIIGSFIVLNLWIFRLRPAPRLTLANIKIIAPIAVCHMLSHMCAAIGFGDGTSEYQHLVVGQTIAIEPLFVALCSAIFLKETFSPLLYLTIVAVVAGFGMAFVEHLDFNFSWVAMGGAAGFNLAASTRAILAKRSMTMDAGNNMSPANLYAVVAIMASAMFVPLAIVKEGFGIKGLWEDIVDSAEDGDDLYWIIALSGIIFHFYNEVAFRCLGRVHPLTHAVGSTFKHIFFAAVLSIGEDIPLSFLGCFVATVGMLLYILAMLEAPLRTQREWKAGERESGGSL